MFPFRASRTGTGGRSSRITSRWTGRLALIGALAGVGALAAPSLAVEFTMFTERDFVQIGGLSAGDAVDIDVFRSGQLVGKAHNVPVFEDPPASGDFIALVNHPGGANTCWDQSTPDLLPGDVVRATVNSVAEEATIADIAVTGPPTSPIADTVVVTGTAKGPGGQRLPLAEIEQRLRSQSPLFTNGKNSIRAPGEGTLAYDDPGDPTNPAWTATYTVPGIGAADVATALAAEARIMHFAGAVLPNGAFPAVTIFEFGVIGGPQIPGCPPIEIGPSITLAPSSDSGSSAADRITNVRTPTFTGARGSIAALSPVTLYDTTPSTLTPIGTATLGLDGSFVVTATVPLADGVHAIRAGHPVTSPTDVLGPTHLITIDGTAPAAPAISGTSPGSPADDDTPQVRGAAEAGSLVRVYGGPNCTGTPLAVGPAAAFATDGLEVTVANAATTLLSATAQDVAGNVSPCSAPLAYREVSPTMAVISAGTRMRTNGQVFVAITCRGLFAGRCAGRLALTRTIRTRRAPGRPARTKTIVAGVASFGATTRGVTRVRIRLSTATRRLLVGRRAIRLRVRIAPSAGTLIARSSRATILIVAPRGSPR